MGEESKESHDDVTKSKYLTRDHIEKKYGQKKRPQVGEWELYICTSKKIKK